VKITGYEVHHYAVSKVQMSYLPFSQTHVFSDFTLSLTRT